MFEEAVCQVNNPSYLEIQIWWRDLSITNSFSPWPQLGMTRPLRLVSGTLTWGPGLSWTWVVDHNINLIFPVPVWPYVPNLCSLLTRRLRLIWLLPIFLVTFYISWNLIVLMADCLIFLARESGCLGVSVRVSPGMFCIGVLVLGASAQWVVAFILCPTCQYNISPSAGREG